MNFLLAVVTTLFIEYPSDFAGIAWWVWYSVRYSRVASKLFP